jgi:hypothetical protein
MSTAGSTFLRITALAGARPYGEWRARRTVCAVDRLRVSLLKTEYFMAY